MKRYRKTERGGGLFSATAHEQAVAAKSTGILKLRDVILWESFRPLLEKLTVPTSISFKKPRLSFLLSSGSFHHRSGRPRGRS